MINADKLLIKFAKIFLEVSSKLQKIEDSWDAVLRYTYEEVRAIYGFYMELQHWNKRVVYFLNPSTEQQDFKLFFPYLKQIHRKDLPIHHSIRHNHADTFESEINFPKPYYLLQKESNKIYTYYLNNYIPLQVIKEYDFYVVLYDEIAFFQFAYAYIENKQILINERDFVYILKFGLSVEAAICENKQLHNYLRLNDFVGYWGKEEELGLRAKIDNIDMSVYSKEKIIVMLETIIDKLISHYGYLLLDKKTVLTFIARFDLETSFLIVDENSDFIPHDYFVLPLYRTDKPVFTSSFKLHDFAIKVDSPVIGVFYIETLKLITNGKQVDEDIDSLKGFQLTKEIIKLFAKYFIDNHYLKEVVKSEKYAPAITAAISQVMMRNMSHNMGSHVLSRLVNADGVIKDLVYQPWNFYKGEDNEWARQYQHLNLIPNRGLSYKYAEELSERSKKGKSILAQILKDNEKILSLEGSSVQKEIDEQILPYALSAAHRHRVSHLIANFNSYMKSRMDFLADVTTNVPTLESTKGIMRDVMMVLDRNRLLLDRISGIENFHYTFKLRNLTDESCKDCISGKGCDKCWIFEKTEYKSGKGAESEIQHDVLVSIPNDVLGYHAFYTILENIIRNTAKHATTTASDKDNPVRFYIDIENCKEHDAYYEVTLYDDTEIVTSENFELSKEECEDWEKNHKLLPENFPKTHLERLVLKQNILINSPILKEDTAQLREGGWGLIEMEASAAYLRKIPVYEIDDDKYAIDLNQPESKYSPLASDGQEKALNIFKAVKKNNHLAYKMYLLKPKELLIIDGRVDKGSEFDETTWQNLAKQGVECISYEDFIRENKKVYVHKLVVVLGEQKIPADRNTYLTSRIAYLEKELSYEILRLLEQNQIKSAYLLTMLKYLIDTKIELFRYDFWFEVSKKEYEENKHISALFSQLTLHEVQEAYYSDHGKDYFKLSPESGRSRPLIDDYDFCEIDTSLNKLNKPKEEETVDYLQLIESQSRKIIVLDERIQQYAENATYKPRSGEPIPIHKIYKKTYVLVPRPEQCNLNRQSFYDKEVNTYKLIIKYLSDTSKLFTIDFLVIHLGIIEKMIKAHNELNPNQTYNKDRKESVSDFLEGVICLPFNINRDRLVIISGRGLPPNLPAGMRYLNYSIVAQYLIDIRSKYLLNEIVFSARSLQ